MADLKKYITEPGLIFEGFFRQVSSYSVFQNKSEFKVKVLTNPIPYTGPDPDIETGDPSSDQRSQKYWFKGRILDPNMAHEKFLPDPCDNTIAEDPEYTQALISLHATVFAEVEPDCSIGDVVLAFIGPGDNNKIYNLQHMKWIKTETKNSGPLVIGQECFKLSKYDFTDATDLDSITSGFIQVTKCMNESFEKKSISELSPSQTLYDTLKSSEAFVPYVYDDKVGGKTALNSYESAKGFPTIGYGHLIYREGQKDEREKWREYLSGGNKRLSQEQANRLFIKDVSEHLPNDYITVQLTQNQYDALVSLIFNIGVRQFSNSRVRNFLNNGDCVAAAQAFGDHITSKNEVVEGLVKRRNEESQWFSGNQIPK